METHGSEIALPIFMTEYRIAGGCGEMDDDVQPERKVLLMNKSKLQENEQTPLDNMSQEQMRKALLNTNAALKDKPQTLQKPTSSGGKTSSTAESPSSFVEGFTAHLMRTKGISREAAEEWASWM